MLTKRMLQHLIDYINDQSSPWFEKKPQNYLIFLKK